MEYFVVVMIMARTANTALHLHLSLFLLQLSLFLFSLSFPKYRTYFFKLFSRTTSQMSIPSLQGGAREDTLEGREHGLRPEGQQ